LVGGALPQEERAVSKLRRVPDLLRRAENREVLAFLEGRSAHSDVADTLLQAAAPLGDVQSFCPDLAGYGYVLLSTQGIVFAFAVGMNQVGVRLDDEYKRRALETGGRDAPEIGQDWAAFQLFRSDFPAVDLPFWTRKAYAMARGADPS
jgi:hypothetical protein